jgi:O-antigen ligase
MSKDYQIENSSGELARYIRGMVPKNIPWFPFVFIGVVLASLGAFAISFGSDDLRNYVVVGILGLFGAILVFQRPDLGAYLLIISVFTNASDLLTENGLPGINKPLIALTMMSVLANYLLRTGKYSRFPEFSRVEWALIVYYLAIVASTFISTDKTYVLDRIMNITKDILVGASIFLTLNTRERWEKGVWIFIIVMTIVAGLGVIKTITGTESTFLGLAQLSAYGQVGEGGELRYGGPIGESNLWGQILAATLPFIIYRFKFEKNDLRKILLVVSMLLVGSAAIFTSSRGVIVALIVVIPLIALEIRVKPVTVLVGILAAMLAFNFLPSTYKQRIQTLSVLFQPQDPNALSQDDSFIGRKNELVAGLAMAQDYPLLGVGFGNYPNYYWEYASKLGLSGSSGRSSDQEEKLAHSLYVEVLSETGMIGLITFSAFFGLIFTGLLDGRRKSLQDSADSDWAVWLNAMIFAMLIFLVSGIFLHGLLFRYIWMLIGFALSGIALSKAALRTTQRVTNRNKYL